MGRGVDRVFVESRRGKDLAPILSLGTGERDAVEEMASFLLRLKEGVRWPGLALILSLGTGERWRGEAVTVRGMVARWQM